MAKGLAREGGWLKLVAACIGLVEYLQVGGPPVKRDRGTHSFPPESSIVAEPDFCTGKASVGTHD